MSVAHSLADTYCSAGLNREENTQGDGFGGTYVFRNDDCDVLSFQQLFFAMLIDNDVLSVQQWTVSLTRSTRKASLDLHVRPQGDTTRRSHTAIVECLCPSILRCYRSYPRLFEAAVNVGKKGYLSPRAERECSNTCGSGDAAKGQILPS